MLGKLAGLAVWLYGLFLLVQEQRDQWIDPARVIAGLG